MSNLDKLEKLATNALLTDNQRQSIGAYIGAMDPETTLKLIAVARAAEKLQKEFDGALVDDWLVNLKAAREELYKALCSLEPQEPPSYAERAWGDPKHE